jgi:hypothetical protein
MSVNTLFNNLKTALFILVILCDVVAHGQSSQASAVTKKPQSDLQQSASEVSELIATDGDRKISVEDSFSLSKGYLVKVPANHPTTPTPYSGSFEGVPNNGTMKIDMEAGFNLVGNPYPSAINVQGFINSNPSTTGTILKLATNRIGLSIWRKDFLLMQRQIQS